MDTSVFESYESEVRSYCRHFPTVFTKAKDAKFYDEDRNLLMEVEPWQGCHWTQSTGRIDLISHFDDTRNPLL